MSLVENLLNQISTKELGGISKPASFDMNDDTFAKLLEKELNARIEEPQSNILNNLLAFPLGKKWYKELIVYNIIIEIPYTIMLNNPYPSEYTTENIIPNTKAVIPKPPPTI